MKLHETDLDGVKLLEPEIHRDSRGYFLETFRNDFFRNRGVQTAFVQDNFSYSREGVIRGLHYQIAPAAQEKLVMVVYGEILDVAVDIRRDSPTFGKHVSVVLNSETHRMLWIREGFAHGFSVLSDSAAISYKCSATYNPALECGIRWNDPDLDIDWRVSKPRVSDKDATQPALSELSERDLF